MLVRAVAAHEAIDDKDAALALAAEAQIRGIDSVEFDAVQRKHEQPKQGVLREGITMGNFIAFAMRESAGAESLVKMRWFLQSGNLPHVDRRDEKGNNVLWGVLEALVTANSNREGEGCIPMLALLLQAGADPNQRYDGGKTPLMYAARAGYATAVAAVLGAGGRVDAADDHGWTAFHAVRMKHSQAMRFNAMDGHEHDDTRGHNHSGGGGDECSDGGGSQSGGVNALVVVRTLLDAGADPSLQNAAGTTPLMSAALNGARDVAVELLRERRGGAKLLRQRSMRGMSAIMIGHRAQKSEVGPGINNSKLQNVLRHICQPWSLELINTPHALMF